MDDIRRLGEAAPFAWSTYEFARTDSQYLYTQTIGAAAGKPAADAGWDGREIVAFRLHLPSKIEYHNTGADNLRRGNILVWEQPLTDRLRGVPLLLDARMETQSILYTTLWLFGVTFVAVAAAVWNRRGGGEAQRIARGGQAGPGWRGWLGGPAGFTCPARLTCPTCSSLESNAECEPEYPRRRVGLAVGGGPEVRTVVPVHALDRRRRKRIEARERRGRRVRQHGLTDGGQVGATAVHEHGGAAAAAQVERVEDVDRTAWKNRSMCRLPEDLSA